MEDLLFYIITDILASQDSAGLWNSRNPYHNVLTANAARHLRMMGLTLRSRWNLHNRTGDKGNLLFTVEELLLRAFHAPNQTNYSRWEADVWDDCWILRALLEFQPEFKDEAIQKWLPDISNEFDRDYRDSVNWLERQFDENGFNEKVQKADWYGPAHYAAAIELFDHRKVKDDFPQAKQNIEILARAVKPMLEREPGARGKWDKLFGWHIGQFVVTWKEKRGDHDPLKALDTVVDDLFKELVRRQHEEGYWDEKSLTEQDKVYNTVRALAACYVNTPEDYFINSPTINLAHRYLLRISQKYSGPIGDIKGSINTFEALQKLFEFQFQNIFPTILFMLPMRLNDYGILDNVLNPRGNDVDTLREIRAGARRQLESQGKTGLEVLGVNDQLIRSLKHRDEFLKEFTGDRRKAPSEMERQEIRKELTRFLSATITETRSRSARRLIKRLWHTDGFLNFIPLIQHLSELEQDGAFYKYYRDHLNHEVLLFLLGAYIYYNCAAFRNPVNEEILKIYEENKVSFDETKLEAEFLFRWKLISTFHDIGYLFEVDPVDKSRTKRDLLKKSFGVVDAFRENFLYDYFLQYVNTRPAAGLTPEEAKNQREEEVRELAEQVAKGLNPYDDAITKVKDLSRLRTPRREYRNAFKLISRYVNGPYIGENLIESYFKLCAKTRVSEDRDDFLDHGVMSALVLLKAADIQRHYVNELMSRDFTGTLDPQLREVLDREDTRVHVTGKQFFIRFSHVAGAIALHNIAPPLYTKEQCEEFDNNNGTELTRAFHQSVGEPGRYVISLAENPLSYLTALADSLQDWDRHSFRRVAFGDDSGDPLSASEVVIGFDDGKINVRPLTAQASDKYESMTKPKAFDQYLEDWRQYVTIHNFDSP